MTASAHTATLAAHMGRPSDGTVGRLLDDPRYLDGSHGVTYVVDLGTCSPAGLRMAYVDRFGRRRICAVAGVVEAAVPLVAQLARRWLVEHDGEGGDVLPT